MKKPASLFAVIRWHRLFEGIFERIATQAGVDPSYVSKIVSGHRNSVSILAALRKEVERLETLKPR